MPSLVACNRRWGIGSDDLVFPGLAELCVRIAWLLAISIVLGMHQTDLSLCSGGDLLQVYYIGMLTLLSLHILLTCAIIAVSARGTILEDAPRRHIPSLVYIKLAFFGLELIWTAIGTYWAFGTDIVSCAHEVVITVKGAVLAGWVILAALGVSVFAVFDSLGHVTLNAGNTEEEEARLSSRVGAVWERRCRMLCCCVWDDRSADAFQDIARIFYSFFKDVDLVMTDVAAGMLLIWKQQKQHGGGSLEEQLFSEGVSSSTMSTAERGAPEVLIGTEAPPVSVSARARAERKDWMTLANAARYIKFAKASYGWPFYIYTHMGTGVCVLCSTYRCCACFRGAGNAVNDNCCECNLASVLKTTGLRHVDILYASFHNKIYEIPFYIALDHSRKVVVVAIRGTLSLTDALTDLTAGSESFSLPGVEGSSSVHKGILRAAKFVFDQIHDLRLLATAFNEQPDYELMITGHSLGAGAAAILALLLRAEYPNLMCFAFSPPGGLLSQAWALLTEDFICSVVVGLDLVPRLSLKTLSRMKQHILLVLNESRSPKYKIIAGGCCNALFGCSSPNCVDDTTSLLPSVSVQTYTSGNVSDRRFLQVIQATIENLSKQSWDVMYLPGLVMYLEEETPARGCFGSYCSIPEYKMTLVRADAFNTILISPRMLYDHLPDLVDAALEQLVEKQSTQAEGNFSHERQWDEVAANC